MNAFKVGDIQWFPAGRSLFLERKRDAAATARIASSGGEEISQNTMIELIEANLESIEDKVREISKKF